MSFFSPLTRRGMAIHSRPLCSGFSLPAKQWARQSSAVAFRPSFVAFHPRLPPQPPHSARPSSHVHPESTERSRKPEDLYPESFPIDEKDLVNPSGRIYSVRRPPNEDEGESENRKALQDQLAQYETLFVPLSEAKQPPIFRALLFFLFGGGLIYCGAAAYSVKTTDDAALRVNQGKSGGIFGDFSSFFGATGNGRKNKEVPSLDERQYKAAQKQKQAEKLGRGLRRLMKGCDQVGIPQGGKQTIVRMYTWVAESYLHLQEDKSSLVPIFAVTSSTFIAWKVSMLPSMRNSLQVFMRRYFLHAAASGRTYTMLTSTFSHRGALHFGFNHIAMWSFGATSLAALAITRSEYTPQASLTPHVVAFFCTAGIASALASHLITAVSFRFVAARRGLAAARLSIGRIGSLGASGSAYAMIVMTALTFPDNAIALIFLPMVPISIGYGVAGMVAFDIIGLLFRLRIFDHAAHLGGAAFGYFYYYNGSNIWEACKAYIRAARTRYLKA